jgi:hypothetical protein
MIRHNRPEWIGKAAKAVAALYVMHRVGEHAKEHMEVSEATLKAETEEKIADIIHRHFQEQRA